MVPITKTQNLITLNLNDYVEGANFVKNLRAQLEGKYKSDAPCKAVHAQKMKAVLCIRQA